MLSKTRKETTYPTLSEVSVTSLDIKNVGVCVVKYFQNDHRADNPTAELAVEPRCADSAGLNSGLLAFHCVRQSESGQQLIEHRLPARPLF